MHTDYIDIDEEKGRPFSRPFREGPTVVPCTDLTSDPFPQSTSEVICLDSDDDSDSTYRSPTKLDEEQNNCLFVRVMWGKDIDIFPRRKHQRFYDIFKHYADRGNFSMEYICLNVEGTIIYESDTPDSLNYNTRMLIRGRRMDRPFAMLSEGVRKIPNSIELKIQFARGKLPIMIPLRKTDLFKELYFKLSEEMDIPPSKIILRLDGEALEIYKSPKELGLKGGEVIDCMVKL